jgi:GTP-binding protein
LVDNEVPFVIVFTKTDRVSEQKLEELQGEFKTKLSEWFDPLPEMYSTSAVDRKGRTALIKLIESVVGTSRKGPKTKSPPPRNTPW